MKVNKATTIIGCAGIFVMAASPALANHSAGHDSSAGGLPALEARVSALEAQVASLRPPVSEVTVDCSAGESISDAIALGSGSTLLTVTVIGTCTEDPVLVYRDNVTIQGSIDGAGDPVDTLIGGIDVVGSDRVTIKNLVVLDGPSIGIHAREGASITLDNVSVSGHKTSGITVSDTSFARIDKSDVFSPATGGNALFIRDGSAARITNTTLVSANVDLVSTVLINRGSNARFDAGNLITNTNTDPDVNKAQAIQVTGTSNLRILRGGNVVNGNVVISSNSAADLRGLTANGQLGVVSHASTRLSDGTIVNGNALVVNQSLLEAFGAATTVTVTGTVTCFGDSAVSGGAVPALTLVGCPVL